MLVEANDVFDEDSMRSIEGKPLPTLIIHDEQWMIKTSKYQRGKGFKNVRRQLVIYSLMNNHPKSIKN